MQTLSAMWMLFFAAWQAHGSVDGITVETRETPGSAFETVRLTKHMNVPVDQMADAIWYSHEPATKEVVLHKIIEEKPSFRVFYEVISAPVISDRDAVVRVERTTVGEAQRISFKTVDDPRVPPSNKIRMRIEGFFDVTSDGHGGSVVSYQIFTDLRGDVPAWMVNGPKRDAVVGSLKTQLAKAYRKRQVSMQYAR